MAHVGLATIWQGANHYKAVDIVAVHGIGAHPDSTWIKDGKHWLKDEDMLPRAVPNTRIMRFAYESQWLGAKMISQTLRAVSESLLQSLLQEREGCPERPIIFIGHCFGGIIIEKALNLAKLLSKHSSIVDHVAGVIFLATPHKGTGSQSSAAIVANIAAYAKIGQRSHLVDSLEPNSKLLDDVVRDFTCLANDIRIPLCCFFEQRTTDITAILRSFVPPFFPRVKVLVVDEHSACLDGFERIGIGSDHFSINKFTSPDSGYYRSVQSQIQNMVEKAHECVQSRTSLATTDTQFLVKIRRNNSFAGREIILTQLENMVHGQRRGQRRAALYGLGGVGKTQIAIELAYRMRDRHSVFWAEGSTKELFKTSLLSIGEKARILLGPEKENENVVREWFDSEESGSWLLIVDNVDNPDELQSILPTNRGAILFTASAREVAGSLADGGQEIHVSSMELEEASTLFRKLKNIRKGDNESVDSDITSLVTHLDCLPIAIVLASAYMKSYSISVNKYTRQLQERMDNHSSDDSHLFGNSTENANVRKTWDISYRPLLEVNDSAAKLLQVFSLLSSSPIPRRILQPSILEPIGAQSDYVIEQALGLLCSLAFVNVSGEDDDRLYQVHRLVMLWARTKITDENLIANTAFDLIAESFPKGTQNSINSRSEGAIFLEHARSIEMFCAQGKTTIEEDRIMKLKRQIGRCYSRIGSSADAETRMRHCIDYYANTGSSSRELATCYNILGTALYSQCKFDEAIDCFDKAYELRKEIFGPDHASTLDVLGDKAVALYSQGKNDEALQTYFQAHDGIMNSPNGADGNGPRLSHIMNGLASLYRGRADFVNASKWYAEGLKTARKAHGPDHPLTWTLVLGSMDVLDKLGRHKKAKDILNQAVEEIAEIHHLGTAVANKDGGELSLSDSHERVFPIVCKLLGEKHGSTVGYMNHIGQSKKNEGRYEEALHWYLKAFNLSVEVYGIDNLSTLDIAHNMSEACSEIGDHKKENEYLDLALKGSIKILGPDHPRVLSTLASKGICLIDQEEYTEAIAVFEKVYAARKTQLGPNHEHTIATLGSIAEAYQELEEYEKAREAYETALKGYTEHFPVGFGPTVDTQQNYAELLIDMGKNKEAIEMLTQVLDRRGSNKVKFYYARSMLGGALVKDGRGEGLAMAQEAFDALKKLVPEGSQYFAFSMRNLAECLRTRGQLEKSLDYYDQVVKLNERNSGSTSVATLETVVDKANVLAQMKNRDMALQEYKRAEQGFESELGLNHPLSIEMKRRHTELTLETHTSSFYRKSLLSLILVLFTALAFYLSLQLSTIIPVEQLRSTLHTMLGPSVQG